MRLLLTASLAALIGTSAAAQGNNDLPVDYPNGPPGYDQPYEDADDPSAYGGLPPAGQDGDYPEPYPDQYDDQGGYDPDDSYPTPSDEDMSDLPPDDSGGPGDEMDDGPYMPGEPEMGDPGQQMGDYEDDAQFYNDAGPIDDLSARQAEVEARIRSSAAQGRLSPDLANNALIELESIRTQQAELTARDGALTATTRGFIEDRLDVLEGRLQNMGAD